MTKEERQLLFQDLSARLPHHVRVKVWLKEGTAEEGILDLEHNYGDVLRDAFYYNEIKDIKPFLRPMSSMTEGEREEYKKLSLIVVQNYDSVILPNMNEIDWLNAHHFDYRGLISKGLAIEVTESNNPYEN